MKKKICFFLNYDYKIQDTIPFLQRQKKRFLIKIVATNFLYFYVKLLITNILQKIIFNKKIDNFRRYNFRE